MLINWEITEMTKNCPIAEMSNHACQSGHFRPLNFIKCFLNIAMLERGPLAIANMNYIVYFFSLCDMRDGDYWEVFDEFTQTLGYLFYFRSEGFLKLL